VPASLSDARIIAVIRLNRPLPLAAARAIAAGGISAIELTLTTPGALDSIAELVKALPDCQIGAGTVLDEVQARSGLAAGASFCVSPVYDPLIQELCREAAAGYMPGGFTPTELLAAHRSGASRIKLFPAGAVGPGYVRDLLAPMPFLSLVPSGGVSAGNAAAWLEAGAKAVSVGSALLDDETLDPATLEDRARKLVAAVNAVR